MNGGKPQRADALRNRELILDAAAAVMAREPEPTLSMIANEAGISRATIYRHFSDLAAVREALLEDVAQVAREVLQEYLRPPADAAGTFPERMLSLVRAALPTRTRYSVAMARDPDPDAGAMALLVSMVTALVKQAQADSEIRHDLDPRQMAEFLITTGFYAARRVHRDGVPVDEAARVMEVVMRGMETSPRSSSGG